MPIGLITMVILNLSTFIPVFQCVYSNNVCVSSSKYLYSLSCTIESFYHFICIIRSRVNLLAGKKHIWVWAAYCCQSKQQPLSPQACSSIPADPQFVR